MNPLLKSAINKVMNSENAKYRSDLADKMARRTGLLKKDCFRVIEVMIEEMNASLKSGAGLHFHNFGKFKYYVRPATQRRDPYTGEYIPVPPATRVKFIPCRDIKYGVVTLPWEKYLSEKQLNSDWYKKMKESEE